MSINRFGLAAAATISLVSNGCAFSGKQSLLSNFDATHDGPQAGGNEVILCVEGETDASKRQEMINSKVADLLKGTTECPSHHMSINPNGASVVIAEGGTKAENTNSLCQNYVIMRGDCLEE